ncbi:MAG: SGNH/GDSL hydrolase family protein [Tyzzerella sp.]|nr:SGNH/GDSL hydrolase family protein [Tyzzerella sp.]
MELRGIKMGCLGDSITQGVGVTDLSNMYYNRIQRECGIRELYIDGISGTRISRQHTPSAEPTFDLDFISRVDKMDEDCDLVVVFGGTNDFGHGDAPIGEPTDRTPDTFWGACHVLCEKLINRFPKSQIVFMTPLHRITEENPNQHGKVLEDYVTILKTVLKKYSIPALDMMEKGGIAPRVPVHQELYMPDGLHPNDAGQGLIAARLKGFLQSL